MLILFWVCAVLLFYTYFGYLFILLIAVRFISEKNVEQRNMAEDLPTVDLLIAAYNEEKVIDRKIRNSLGQDYPKELLKIWIASDGSSDNTVSISKEYAETYENVHLLDFDRMGKSNVLNKALPKMKSDIIVFSDANAEFSKDALKKMIKHFSDKKVGCVCGKLVYSNPGEIVSGKGESFYWKYETLLKKLESRIGYVAGANGAIYAIRNNLIDSLSPGTINDDFVLSMKIVQKGYKSLYEEDALAYEEVAPSVEHEFKRHVRDGAGHYIAMAHLLGLLNPFLGIRAFIYWSHRVIRWIAPFVIIALFWANTYLLGSLLYNVTFSLQVIAYVLAISGLFLHKKKKLPFFVYIPFYFFNLNIALFFGFVKAISGRQHMTWESTERRAVSRV